jgi:GntR family transcriptional regulator/MocR family aminotransferase
VPKARQGAILTTLTLDGDMDLPLHRQLYLRIRDLILEGRLEPASRLPSTRTLAKELGLSRSTVVNAVEQLITEEYLEARVGDGTYVTACRCRDEAPLGAPPLPAATAQSAPPKAPPRLSRRGEGIYRAPLGGDPTAPRPFNVGVPDFDAFPHGVWQRLFQRRLKEMDGRTMSYGAPAGYPPLREAVARYVTTARGVRCTAEQVIIVSSSQQALDMASRVLLDPGDAAWLEDPGYLGARGALLAAEARLIPVPVDGEGIDVTAGIETGPEARLVHVTPSHQYPTGATLSLERRLALLDWAATTGAWIVEDDYDSEFRYSGRPLASLQGLDRSGRVLYVGTFTKVLYPSLRLAYLVVPEPLVEPFIAARSFIDRHPPTLPQAVTADFLEGGHFSSHLRKMRALYSRRQEALLDALERHTRTVGLPLHAAPDPAGMHLAIGLPPDLCDPTLARRCLEAGVAVTPMSRFALRPEALSTGSDALMLGYTGFDEAAIEAGAETLVRVLAAGSDRPAPARAAGSRQGSARPAGALTARRP